jgi:hypothetical protein
VRGYPSSQSRFPAQRAFVVQVAVPEPGVADVPLGRAEHVISGTATHFATWAELVAFIEKVLAQEEPHVGDLPPPSHRLTVRRRG